MNNFTKGNWEIFDAYKETHGIAIRTNGYGELARCKGDNMEANAQLIASAPDLYEACKNFIEYCQRPKYEQTPLKMKRVKMRIERALAKAEANQ